MDNKLSWTKHINNIVERSTKRLNLLRCISGTTWGNRHDILYLVYKGLIRSILDYGCELYDSASKSFTPKKIKRNKLVAIQYKALKIITGALH